MYIKGPLRRYNDLSFVIVTNQSVPQKATDEARRISVIFLPNYCNQSGRWERNLFYFWPKWPQWFIMIRFLNLRRMRKIFYYRWSSEVVVQVKLILKNHTCNQSKSNAILPIEMSKTERNEEKKQFRKTIQVLSVKKCHIQP